MDAAQPPRSWWAIAFVTVTAVGLGALAWAVLMMHALTYGMTEVLGMARPDPPDTDRYGWALAVGVAVDAAVTAAMLWQLGRTAARQWPAWVTALLAAVVGGATGASALLLVLGINPIDVL